MSRAMAIIGLLVVASSCTATPTGEPRTNLELHLNLPYAWGEAYTVVQGNDGADTHRARERFAVDFAMPEGTPVLAAAGGRVVTVIDGFTAHGRESSFAERANVIVVDMGDGVFAVYRHLASQGAAVHEGDVVLRGQLLGRSGNTGMSVNPHLHFAVVDHVNQSLPIAFVEGAIREGNALPSKNGTPVASRLPRDAFAANGVTLDTDLALSPWSAREALHLSGHADGAQHVVAFLVDRAAVTVVRRSLGAVRDDGSFVLALALDGLDGAFDFALARVGADGEFHSDYGVPIVVRDRQALSQGEVR